MSEAALLQAVRDKLQATFGLDADSCEIGFDGRPKPACGELYFAVHPLSWQNADTDFGLDESFGCSVTLTRRLGYSPEDRWGPEVLVKAGTGVDPVLRTAMLALHDQYDVIKNATETYLSLTYGGPGSFQEPLRFRDGGTPQVQGPDWFGAEDADGPGRFANAGVSRTLTFGGARRVQGPADGGMS